MKKIANIVFYKFNGERPNMKQACIFYTDGTVKNVSYEEGLEACQEIVVANNIKSKAEFKEIINNRLVYVMSGKDFEERFQTFISREDVKNVNSDEAQAMGEKTYQKVLTPENKNANQLNNNNANTVPSVKNIENIIEAVDEEIKDQASNKDSFKQEPENYVNHYVEPETDARSESIKNDVKEPIIENRFNNKTGNEVNVERPIAENKDNAKTNNGLNNESPITENKDNNRTDNGYKNERPVIVPESNKNDNKEKTKTNNTENRFVNHEDRPVIIPPIANHNEKDSTRVNPIEDEDLEDENQDVNEKENHETPIVDIPVENSDGSFDINVDEEQPIDEMDSDDIDTDIEDEIEMGEKPQKKENKFVAWIKRGVEKIKNMKLVKKITAVVLALAVGLGLYSCASKQTKTGQMLNSNIPSNSQDYDENLTKRGDHLFLIHGNNDHYNDYSFDELQKVTKNQSQKTSMASVATTLNGFNGDFAAAHTEEGKDVKAALTFDEIVALQQAYNNYSNDEIRAIFNGASIRSDEMSRAYKDANLQLMGAYVIETREHPVDMSGLIISEEGRAFYKKYQDLFLDAKEATGDDKIAKIELFYKAVREDFPITREVRTEGIAHSDDYATIEPYKLAVTPIISAAEIMFQNYKVDVTLNDSEIDFLNDLGLCNYADETFERIETITLTSEEDNKNPLYNQYRDSIIYMMKQDGNYFVDNEHRELTKLDAFQEQVNWHTYGGYWHYSTYTTTETHTETRTWTESETETRVEETREEKPITEEAQEEVDQQIEEENEEARREAEEEAERRRQEMQEEANQEAERIEEEVRQDEEDLQENIEEANEQITQNQDGDPSNDAPVNEDDLGHGVQFDEEHQDGNGNLNDSVENITTDPHGDETGLDFPDPNETGKAFDEAGETTYAESSGQTADGSFTTEFDGQSFSVEENAQQRSVSEPTQTQTQVDSQEQQVYEYEEPVTNEQLVDQYIEQLASEQPAEEESYQYTK